jgi:transcriptional regulator with XRE-family HTH domain
MLRLELGLSQQDLADKTGLSEDSISNIERGESWIGEMTLSLLTGALEVPQQALFDYSKNADFVKAGGMTKRAPRKPPHLIVRRKRQVIIRIPKNK